MTGLAEILAPFQLLPPRRTRTPLGPGGWFVRDVPPGVAADALALVPARVAAARPGGQPPALWLVACAGELGGRLIGSVAVDLSDPPGAGATLRFDGLKVPRERAGALVAAVRSEWPAVGAGHGAGDGDGGGEGARGESRSGALDTSVGEVYPTWGTLRVTWQGPGTELQVHVPHGDVVGLWWP